jgi:hypothetical protein
VLSDAKMCAKAVSKDHYNDAVMRRIAKKVVAFEEAIVNVHRGEHTLIVIRVRALT